MQRRALPLNCFFFFFSFLVFRSASFGGWKRLNRLLHYSIFLFDLPWSCVPNIWLDSFNWLTESLGLVIIWISAEDSVGLIEKWIIVQKILISECLIVNRSFETKFRSQIIIFKNKIHTFWMNSWIHLSKNNCRQVNMNKFCASNQKNKKEKNSLLKLSSASFDTLTTSGRFVFITFLYTLYTTITYDVVHRMDFKSLFLSNKEPLSHLFGSFSLSLLSYHTI